MNAIVAVVGALEGLLKGLALLLFAVFLLRIAGSVRTAVEIVARRERQKRLSGANAKRALRLLTKAIGPDEA